MYQSGNEKYCAAFETALAELEQIYSEFQRMRIRKERIEGVLEALRPLVDSADHIVAQVNQPSQVSSPSSSPVIEPEATPHQSPAQPLASANVSSDPLQRRIDSVLGLAVA
jgi:hypothetical protein